MAKICIIGDDRDEFPSIKFLAKQNEHEIVSTIGFSADFDASVKKADVVIALLKYPMEDWEFFHIGYALGDYKLVCLHLVEDFPALRTACEKIQGVASVTWEVGDLAKILRILKDLDFGRVDNRMVAAIEQISELGGVYAEPASGG